MFDQHIHFIPSFVALPLRAVHDRPESMLLTLCMHVTPALIHSHSQIKITPERHASATILFLIFHTMHAVVFVRSQS